MDIGAGIAGSLRPPTLRATRPAAKQLAEHKAIFQLDLIEYRRLADMRFTVDLFLSASLAVNRHGNVSSCTDVISAWQHISMMIAIIE
jgi:hypothetical protein